MKINRINRVSQLYKANKTKSIKDSKGKGKEDSLVLSGFAQQMQTVRNVLKDIPEIRTEKVERIKSEIEAGTYNVSSKEVAKKMLQSGFNYKV